MKVINVVKENESKDKYLYRELLIASSSSYAFQCNKQIRGHLDANAFCSYVVSHSQETITSKS